jgi:hypothetical protein
MHPTSTGETTKVILWFIEKTPTTPRPDNAKKVVGLHPARQSVRLLCRISCPGEAAPVGPLDSVAAIIAPGRRERTTSPVSVSGRRLSRSDANLCLSEGALRQHGLFVFGEEVLVDALEFDCATDSHSHVVLE